jgi:putrescine---pyruvate transaminase
MTAQASRIWSPFCRLPDDRNDAVTIARGEGPYVYDVDGKQYLDGTAGLWYALIGHGRSDMAEAIAEQVRTLEAFKTHGEYDNPPARLLADKLAELFPVDDCLAFFTSGGGDSIETACKLARAYWAACGQPSKRTLISRERAYHGMHGFGTRIAGLDVLRAGSDDGYPAASVPATDAEALEACIERVGAENIAAFIAEPVIGAGGVIIAPPDYLERAQELCRRNDILFICDEVVTGFGRLGTWSGAERFGLQPDLAILAKGITSGYVPLGAVLAARDIWQVFEERGIVFRHGYTYSGHPTACAAALKNLEILASEQLPDHAAGLEGYFKDAVEGLLDVALVNEIRAIGLMAAVGLDPDAARRGAGSTGDLGEEIVRRCRAHGLIVRRMFQGELQISPPLVIGRAEVDFIVDVIARAAGECADELAR